MYLSRVFNHVRPNQQARLISNYPTLRDSKATNKPSVVGETNANAEPTANLEGTSKNPSIDIGRKWVAPSNFDKKILVWMKYYKNVNEVPDKVGYETVDKAQNRFRIRCCNFMMIGTLLCFFISVKWGQKRAKQGETVETINAEWHEKMNKKQ